MALVEGEVGHKRDGKLIEPPKLTLAAKGPGLPVTLSVPRSVADALAKDGKPIPPPVLGMALIDTGAQVTCVDEDAMKRLGLLSHGTGHSHGVNGPAPRPKFACMLEIHQQLAQHPAIFLPDAMAVPLQKVGWVALLGRDFLTDKVLEYHGSTGRYTLAW